MEYNTKRGASAPRFNFCDNINSMQQLTNRHPEFWDKMYNDEHDYSVFSQVLLNKLIVDKQLAGDILDIGCGVAGIDVFLNEHYKNNSPDFYLLDKTEIEKKVFYGLKDKAAFYNSLPVAKKLLIENGVKEEKIHTQEVGEDNKIKFGKKFDLVISLISWGFHYPVSTYLDQVYEMLNSGGTLIIDVRNVAGAEDLLINKFGNGKVIYERKKEKRFVFKKP